MVGYCQVSQSKIGCGHVFGSFIDQYVNDKYFNSHEDEAVAILDEIHIGAATTLKIQKIVGLKLLIAHIIVHWVIDQLFGLLVPARLLELCLTILWMWSDPRESIGL